MAHAVTTLPCIRKVYNSILWQNNEYPLVSLLCSVRCGAMPVRCLRPDHCHITSPGEVPGSHSGAAQDTDLMGCDCGNTQRHIPRELSVLLHPFQFTPTSIFAVFELQTALSNCSQIQLNQYGKLLKTDRQNDLQMYTKRKVIRPAFERYTVPV